MKTLEDNQQFQDLPDGRYKFYCQTQNNPHWFEKRWYEKGFITPLRKHVLNSVLNYFGSEQKIIHIGELELLLPSCKVWLQENEQWHTDDFSAEAVYLVKGGLNNETKTLVKDFIKV